jgi:eukaryotic-like serine/threonine-protein kinase
MVARGDGDAWIGRTLVDRFTIKERIAAGGTGTIYRAAETGSSRDVALKLIHATYAKDGSTIDRFLRAAKAMSALGQAHLPSVLSFGKTEDGLLFAAMEYLTGRTLRQLIEDEGTLTVDRAAALAIQICEAFEAMHRSEVPHGDLKPSHVMVLDQPSDRDHVKVLDFGLPTAILGHTEANVAQDLRSLGVLLCALIDGRPFAQERSAQTISEHVPPMLRAVILRLLAEDPLLYYDGASSVKQELIDILEVSGQATMPRAMTDGTPTVPILTRREPISLPSRFILEQRLGAGGMGVVYRARDTEQNVTVAVKTLRNIDPLSLYLFKNEFRALADLSHPNLVRLGELIRENDLWFLTMEYVEGINLLSHLKLSAPSLDEKLTRRLFSQLASALCRLHDAGKVHRDVKPTNVLVTKEDRVVLLDFGLVTEIGASDLVKGGEFVGTPAYMSPEQADGSVGPPTDWYSFGVMLYEALAGTLPLKGSGLPMIVAKQTFTPTAPSKVREGISPELDALVLDLLAAKPEARPTGPEVLRRLGRAERRTDTTVPAGGAAPFVGRTLELELLKKAFGDSKSAPVAVMVKGDSGIGKSALVTRFLDHLAREDRETLIFSGRCYERESLPYKALDGIIDSLTKYLFHLEAEQTARFHPQIKLLARLFPVLSRVSPGPERNDEQENANLVRAQAFRALRELLVMLTQERRVVLFVDDLQWADADSLMMLKEVLQPDGAPKLFVVATLRAGEPPFPGDLRFIPLSNLPIEDTKELAKLLLQGARSDSKIEAIALDAKGHPLFLQELVLSSTDDDLSLPLDEVLWSRAARIDPGSRRLLEIVALAGIPIQIATAADAAQMDPSDCLRWAASLRELRLLRSSTRTANAIEAYHDRVRESVVSHLAIETKTAHHLSIARALEKSGAGESAPHALVHHLALGGDRERAAVVSEKAGDRAAQALAFEGAAELYRSALSLAGDDPEQRYRVGRKLGHAIAGAGRGVEAAEAFLEAARSAQDVRAIECKCEAVDHLLGSGNVDRGLEIARELLAELGGSLPSSTAGKVASFLWEEAKLKTRRLEIPAKSAEPPADRDRLRVVLYNIVANNLGVVDPLLAANAAVRALRLSLGLGDPQLFGQALALEAIFRAFGGTDTSDLLPMLGDLAKSSTEMEAWLGAVESVRKITTGKFQEASEVALAAESCFRRLPIAPWGINKLRMLRLLALHHLGNIGEAVDALEEYRRDAARRNDQFAQGSVYRSLALLWLARDDPEKVEADLRTPGSRAGGEVLAYNESVAKGGVALYVRDREGIAKADRTLKGYDRSLNVVGSPFMRAGHRFWRARLALGRSELGDEGALKEALRFGKLLEAEPGIYGGIWAALIYAAGELRFGRKEGAIAHLERAIEASRGWMAIEHAIAKRRHGEIIGGARGAELVLEGNAEMISRGSKSPDRTTAYYVPGFELTG